MLIEMTINVELAPQSGQKNEKERRERVEFLLTSIDQNQFRLTAFCLGYSH